MESRIAYSGICLAPSAASACITAIGVRNVSVVLRGVCVAVVAVGAGAIRPCANA